jgi:hypothetical protein
MKKPNPKSDNSIGDRIAVGLFSAVSALILGSIIWFAIFWKFMPGTELSFKPVIYFTAVMFILGFVLLQNLLTKIIEILFKLIKGVGDA